MPLSTSNTPAAAASNAGPDGGIFQAFKPGTTQSKAYTGTAGTIDNAVGTSLIRVLCTSDAFIAVGSAPTATTSDMIVIANQAEYFICNADDKVSAIQSSANGTLYVTAAATAL